MAQPKNQVDVLIIGAGSAGMMAATCAAAYGLEARIIDKRPEKLLAGHGDGIAPRTIEILDSFGLAHGIVQEGAEFTQMHRWQPNDKGMLERREIIAFKDFNKNSRFSTFGLSQARISDLMLDFIDRNSALEIERSTIVENIKVEQGTDYPVKVTTRKVSIKKAAKSDQRNNDVRLDDDDELLKDSLPAQTIGAKYVVACDGAHSFTRRQLGIPMVGDDLDIMWGVMDIVPITDFPSARVTNMIAGENGGLLWIPRERGLVRIYRTLTTASAQDGKLVRSSVTTEKILDAIQKALHPFKLTYKIIDWWAAYQIGQRVATENVDASGRIFLTGDGVHTHSPQAGQGMNVSMQDAFNLMWKLNLVVKGQARPSLLHTYTEERLVLAQELVDFDRQYAALASGREPPPGILNLPRRLAIDQLPKKFGLIVSNLQVLYGPNVLNWNSAKLVEQTNSFLDNGQLPPGIVVGMRMPPAAVSRHADAQVVQFTEAMPSDGRFRILLFPGDLSEPQRLQMFRNMADKLNNVTRKYTGSQQKSFFDAITLHTANPEHLRLLDLPEACHPFDEERGWDTTKVYFDGGVHGGDVFKVGEAYKKYDIDPTVGCLVILRPDLYVGYRGNIEDLDQVQQYFGGFLTETGGS